MRAQELAPSHEEDCHCSPAQTTSFLRPQPPSCNKQGPCAACSMHAPVRQLAGQGGMRNTVPAVRARVGSTVGFAASSAARSTEN